jgi:hypothetical protein
MVLVEAVFRSFEAVADKCRRMEEKANLVGVWRVEVQSLAKAQEELSNQ